MNLITIGMARKDTTPSANIPSNCWCCVRTPKPRSKAWQPVRFSPTTTTPLRAVRQTGGVTPDHFERWFNLGVAEQKRNDLAEAAKAYGEAIRIRPDAKQAHVNLGIVRQELDDLGGARESYERALQIAPDLADVIYNLASVLEQQGEKGRRRAAVRQTALPQSGLGGRLVPPGLSAAAARRPSRRGRRSRPACASEPNGRKAQLNLGLCVLEPRRPRRRGQGVRER